MKNSIKYATVFLTYLIFHQAIAYNPNFHLLNSENGLSHNNTTSVIRDERGFVWIGTNFGLNRYNGNRFELFTTNSKPFNIINNNVTCLNIDKKGNLLIGTLGGITIFDKKLQSSVNISFKELNQKIEVTSIYPFSENVLFIGSKDFLIIYDYSKLEIIKTISRLSLKVQQAMNFNNIWHFYSYENGCFGMVGNDIYKINNQSFEFTKVMEIADSSKTAFCISKSRNKDELWVAGKNFLVKINLIKKIFTDHFPLIAYNTKQSNIEISTLLQTSNDLIIGFSGYGIGILNKENKFENIELLSFSNFTGANRISSAIEDQAGTYWISTDNGVLFSTPWHRKIETIELDVTKKQLKDLEIRCISKISNQQIWIGTTSGIYEKNTITNAVKFLDLKDISGKNLTNICSIKRLNSGKILIGTSFGVYSLNKNKCIKESFNINPNMLSRVWCIENVGASYYISTLNNLIIQYDTITQTTTQYKTDDQNQSFFNFIIYKNSIYAGGFGAIYKWNNDGSNCRQFKCGNSQICQIVISKNKIIAATQNDGIIEIDTLGNVLKNYINEGKYIVYRIMPYLNNKLLCATNKGLLMLENGKKVILINTTTGLTENSFNFGDIFYKLGSEFVFSTNHKLYKVNGELSANSEIYEPIIDKIRVDDSVYFHPLKTVIPEKIKSTQHLSFYTVWTQWLQNDNNIEYLFCLGKNGEYVTTSGNEWISANIHPGKFLFYLKNSFNNKKYKVYNFKISPVYYQSLWFRSFLVISILGILMILARLYIANSYISKELYLSSIKIINSEKEREKMELQALRSQMNPHLIFNSLSGIQTLIMQKKGEKAVKFLQDFSSLLRSVLDLSSYTTVLLSKEIDFITNFLELHKLRYNDFDYSIKIDEKLNTNNFFIPSMCIQPIVENCFIHAFTQVDEPPRIEIFIEKISESAVMVSVWDNGISFAENFGENKEMSIGLGNLKRRLEKWAEQYKINCEIKIEKQVKGKSVIFELPLLMEIET